MIDCKKQLKRIIKIVYNIGIFFITLGIVSFFIPKILNAPNFLTAEFYFFVFFICMLIDVLMFMVVNNWWGK